MGSRSSSINENRSPTKQIKSESVPGSAASSTPGTPKTTNAVASTVSSVLIEQMISSPLSATPISAKPPPPTTPKPTLPNSKQPPPIPATKPKSISSSPISSNPGTPKPVKKPPPPKPTAKTNPFLKSNTTSNISSIANNPTMSKSQSSSISSLINSFNNNSVNNNNTYEDDEDNKTVASVRTNVSNISSQLSKAFTTHDDDSTIVAESNVKPSAFKNGIFNTDARKGEERKTLARSATLPELCKETTSVEDNIPVKKGSLMKEINEATSGSPQPQGFIFNKKKQPPPIPQKPKKLNEVKPSNDNVSPFDDQFSVQQ